MEFEHIKALIETVSDSTLTEFELKEKDFRISMGKETKIQMVSSSDTTEVPMMAAAPAAPEKERKQILSPLVGTFYAAGAPGEEPYVKVGDRVEKGQVLGIVEAMKLMNEIVSDQEGIVEEILVANEDMVEFEQPLFALK